MGLDGHVALVVGSAATYVAMLNNTLPKGWIRRFTHQEPMVMGGVVLAGLAIALPMFVIPMRRSLGFPTNQYEPHHPGTVWPKKNW